MTSIATSLPELVAGVAAVRAGALTLAVADIAGGNRLDVLFVSAADVAYREGSICAAIGGGTLFLLGLALLLTSLLAGGMLARERRGVGFEGVASLAVWSAGFAVLYPLCGWEGANGPRRCTRVGRSARAAREPSACARRR